MSQLTLHELRAWITGLTSSIAIVVAGICVSVASAAMTPVMHFDQRMTVRTACFQVVTPAGTRSTLFGQRFTDGPVNSSTPAIVLVHGAASSTADWDLSPKWSVARALASTGYVVFSYDRLGFSKSVYSAGPGGGNMLTTAAQRHLLHQVVRQIKTAAYRVTTKSTCSSTANASTLKDRRVIIIGHSSGGWVVAGYPGEYHDTAAMIQADITASFTTAPAPGASFTTDPARPDYYQFFQTRRECETFNTSPPGIVSYAVAVACAPPFLLTPWGEIKGLAQTLADDATYIPRIGHDTPVLLTSGKYDTTEPPAAATKDFRTTARTAVVTSRSTSSRMPGTCSWRTDRYRAGSTRS